MDNTDYIASLISGKVYRMIPDPQAAKDDLVRIVDKSGEDYLYHKAHFAFVDLPRAVANKIRSFEAATTYERIETIQTSGATSDLSD